MATKDLTSSILKRLEEGTAEIYSRYQNLLASSQKSYDQQIKNINKEYETAANQASARAKIDYKNTQEQMADSGYIRSGETVHAALSANANRAGALSDLAVQKARDLTTLASQKASEEAEIGLKAETEADHFRQQMMETLRDQENEDREYEAEKAQKEFENALATEKLNWEKEKYEREAEAAEKTAATATQKNTGNASSNSEAVSDEGIRPGITAYAYLDDIVERYTKTVPGKNYKVVDRDAIREAVAQIVQDTTISRQYRYELFLYAKTMGYTEA